MKQIVVDNPQLALPPPSNNPAINEMRRIMVQQQVIDLPKFAEAYPTLKQDESADTLAKVCSLGWLPAQDHYIPALLQPLMLNVAVNVQKFTLGSRDATLIEPLWGKAAFFKRDTQNNFIRITEWNNFDLVDDATEYMFRQYTRKRSSNCFKAQFPETSNGIFLVFVLQRLLGSEPEMLDLYERLAQLLPEDAVDLMASLQASDVQQPRRRELCEQLAQYAAKQHLLANRIGCIREPFTIGFYPITPQKEVIFQRCQPSRKLDDIRPRCMSPGEALWVRWMQNNYENGDKQIEALFQELIDGRSHLLGSIFAKFTYCFLNIGKVNQQQQIELFQNCYLERELTSDYNEIDHKQSDDCEQIRMQILNKELTGLENYDPRLVLTSLIQLQSGHIPKRLTSQNCLGTINSEDIVNMSHKQFSGQLISSFRNLMFVRLNHISVFKNAGHIRNLLVKIELRTGDKRTIRAIQSYYGPDLLFSQISSGQYHNAYPVFCDEFKLVLPEDIDGQCHIFVQVFQISVSNNRWSPERVPLNMDVNVQNETFHNEMSFDNNELILVHNSIMRDVGCGFHIIKSRDGEFDLASKNHIIQIYPQTDYELTGAQRKQPICQLSVSIMLDSSIHFHYPIFNKFHELFNDYIEFEESQNISVLTRSEQNAQIILSFLKEMHTEIVKEKELKYQSLFHEITVDMINVLLRNSVIFIDFLCQILLHSEINKKSDKFTHLIMESLVQYLKICEQKVVLSYRKQKELMFSHIFQEFLLNQVTKQNSFLQFIIQNSQSSNLIQLFGNNIQVTNSFIDSSLLKMADIDTNNKDSNSLRYFEIPTMLLPIFRCGQVIKYQLSRSILYGGLQMKTNNIQYLEHFLCEKIDIQMRNIRQKIVVDVKSLFEQIMFSFIIISSSQITDIAGQTYNKLFYSVRQLITLLQSSAEHEGIITGISNAASQLAMKALVCKKLDVSDIFMGDGSIQCIKYFDLPIVESLLDLEQCLTNDLWITQIIEESMKWIVVGFDGITQALNTISMLLQRISLYGKRLTVNHYKQIFFIFKCVYKQLNYSDLSQVVLNSVRQLFIILCITFYQVNEYIQLDQKEIKQLFQYLKYAFVAFDAKQTQQLLLQSYEQQKAKQIIQKQQSLIGWCQELESNLGQKLALTSVQPSLIKQPLLTTEIQKKSLMYKRKVEGRSKSLDDAEMGRIVENKPVVQKESTQSLSQFILQSVHHHIINIISYYLDVDVDAAIDVSATLLLSKQPELVKFAVKALKTGRLLPQHSAIVARILFQALTVTKHDYFPQVDEGLIILILQGQQQTLIDILQKQIFSETELLQIQKYIELLMEDVGTRTKLPKNEMALILSGLRKTFQTAKNARQLNEMKADGAKQDVGRYVDLQLADFTNLNAISRYNKLIDIVDKYHQNNYSLEEAFGHLQLAQLLVESSNDEKVHNIFWSTLSFLKRRNISSAREMLVFDQQQLLIQLRQAAQLFLKYNLTDYVVSINTAIRLLFIQLKLLTQSGENIEQLHILLSPEQQLDNPASVGNFYRVGFYSQYTEMQFETFVYHESCVTQTFRSNILSQYQQIVAKLSGAEPPTTGSFSTSDKADDTLKEPLVQIITPQEQARLDPGRYGRTLYISLQTVQPWELSGSAERTVDPQCSISQLLSELAQKQPQLAADYFRCGYEIFYQSGQNELQFCAVPQPLPSVRQRQPVDTAFKVWIGPVAQAALQFATKADALKLPPVIKSPQQFANIMSTVQGTFAPQVNLGPAVVAKMALAELNKQQLKPEEIGAQPIETESDQSEQVQQLFKRKCLNEYVMGLEPAAARQWLQRGLKRLFEAGQLILEQAVKVAGNEGYRDQMGIVQQSQQGWQQQVADISAIFGERWMK